MQVILKQSEIVRALRQYIVKQGIAIQGKDVSMQFTAGRKEQGISVEINVEESDIPGFGSDTPEHEAQVIASDAIEEDDTTHLQASPVNAARLEKSIAQLKSVVPPPITQPLVNAPVAEAKVATEPLNKPEVAVAQAVKADEPPFAVEEAKPVRKSLSSFFPEAEVPAPKKTEALVGEPVAIGEPVTEVTLSDEGTLTIHPAPAAEPAVAEVVAPRKTTSLFS